MNSVSGTGTVAGVVPVRFSGEKPVKNQTTIELPALQSGVYVLVPSRSSKLGDVIINRHVIANDSADIHSVTAYIFPKFRPDH